MGLGHTKIKCEIWDCNNQLNPSFKIKTTYGINIGYITDDYKEILYFCNWCSLGRLCYFHKDNQCSLCV